MSVMYVHKEQGGVVYSPAPPNLTDYYELPHQDVSAIQGKVYDQALDVFVDAPLTDAELKAIGVDIQGNMISLNESNQNGLAAISTMIDKAISLNQSVFPIHPSLETKTGKARLTATNQAEFDLIFLTFGLARQQFFP